MLHDFIRTLEFARFRTREYNSTRFNHEATTWIVAGSMQEHFHRPISSTISSALELEFRDSVPQHIAKVKLRKFSFIK